MATKKRQGVSGRRTARAARKRGAARASAPGSAKTAGMAKKKPVRARGAAKAAGAKRGARATAPRPAAPAASGELAALKARFQREKSALERRLTDSVRELSQLRHHEARVTQLQRQLQERDERLAQLERQVRDRDETIGRLRSQLSEVRNRGREPGPLADEEEVQPSLALGAPAARTFEDFSDDE